jgi:hypothetical protein
MSLVQQSAHNVVASVTDALERLSGDEAVQFWWRDDDAEVSSPALDRLLALSENTGIPVALAVIPGHLKPSLSARLTTTNDVDVLVHGWIHKNHAPKGEPATEYPPSRHIDDVRDELARSLAVLHEAFPKKVLPVFVPPWNRLPVKFEGLLVECGFEGLSSAPGNRLPNPGMANLRRAHCDLNIVATPSAGCGADIKGAAVVAKSIRAGARGPFGVVTHHKLFDGATWELCELFWKSIASFDSVKIVSAREVFCSE